MKKERVLFVCIHNSARSQMAEAWMNHLCGDSFEAESAGLEPGTLNPFAVQAMAEVGIDISKNRTKSVFDMVRTGKTFRFVVAVCDQQSAEKCPIFPGVATRVDWSFPDPSAVKGSEEEKLARAREVRDLVRERIALWCEEICPKEEFAA
ncbi:MAG: arsenate reductase ArsC [Verrucomicrobiota bacterium]|nr:arsenate reductase ArsC [Verrucomicrobiota bacterium]